MTRSYKGWKMHPR